MALQGRACRLKALAVSLSAAGLGLLLSQMGKGGVRPLLQAQTLESALLLSRCASSSKWLNLSESRLFQLKTG